MFVTADLNRSEALEVGHTEEVESSSEATTASNLLVVKTSSGKNVFLKVLPQGSKSNSSVSILVRVFVHLPVVIHCFVQFVLPKTYLLKSSNLLKQPTSTNVHVLQQNEEDEESQDAHINDELNYTEEVEEQEVVETEEVPHLLTDGIEEEVLEDQVVQEDGVVIEDGTFLSENIFETAFVPETEEVFVNEVTLEDNVNEVTIEENVANEVTIDNDISNIHEITVEDEVIVKEEMLDMLQE